MSGEHSLVGRVSRPEYTGENRCLPCTVVNVVLVGLGALLAGALATPLASALVLLGGLGAVYLRGYVVPGTPTLTGSLPDRVLAYFDHHEPAVPDAAADDAPAADVDLEDVLLSAGVVEECAETDDLCLEPSFRERWTDEMATVREEESVTALVRDALGDDVEVADEGEELLAHREGTVLARWPSRAAAVADFAADRALAERHPDWGALDASQRSVVTRGLRAFLDRCPDCGEHLAAEKVTSCCISGQARTVVHCGPCGAVLFRSEPYTDLPAAGE